jgi:hypothetical protein
VNEGNCGLAPLTSSATELSKWDGKLFVSYFFVAFLMCDVISRSGLVHRVVSQWDSCYLGHLDVVIKIEHVSSGLVSNKM